MDFKIIPPITHEEVIACGTGIHQETRDGLGRRYGKGKRRKLKGRARVQYGNGIIRRAEVHWYEANGIGQRDFKIKRFLD